MSDERESEMPPDGVIDVTGAQGGTAEPTESQPAEDQPADPRPTDSDDGVDPPATEEQIRPSLEETSEDQARARGQSAYTDPFTAIPIA